MKNQNQICLVTGASSGIGEAIAVLLAGHGFRVIGTSRVVKRLDKLVKLYPDRFFALDLDVKSDNSVNTLLDRLPKKWREISILVNNAGSDVGGRQPFDRGETKNWLNTIETNVNGVIRVTHAVIKGMIERNSGDVINIGSTSGLESMATTAAYTASKYAINGFSESLRKEHENTGIRVMQILPGMVRTQFAANRHGDAQQGETFYDDYGKWLYPNDVANTVLFALQQPRHVVISQLVVVPKPVHN